MKVVSDQDYSTIIINELIFEKNRRSFEFSKRQFVKKAGGEE